MYAMFYDNSGWGDTLPITTWSFASVDDMRVFVNYPLSTVNYSAIINRIADTATETGVTLDGSTSLYNAGAVTSHDHLTDAPTAGLGWTVNDSGLEDFVFTIATSAADEVFTMPTLSGYTYDYTVDWGDGNTSGACTSYDDADAAHTYATAGTYTIAVSGTMQSIKFYDSTAASQLTSVSNLGYMGWTSFNASFRGCPNVISWESGDCNTANVTSMYAMFYDNGVWGAPPDLSSLDTANVTTMREMFTNNTGWGAPPDLSSFDTANVTDMYRMFYSNTGWGDTLPITTWSFASVADMTDFITYPLSTVNYSAIIIQIADTATETGVPLGASTSKYNAGAVTSHDYLTDAIDATPAGLAWTITDGDLE
jgi:hypothetical protein